MRVVFSYFCVGLNILFVLLLSTPQLLFSAIISFFLIYYFFILLFVDLIAVLTYCKHSFDGTASLNVLHSIFRENLKYLVIYTESSIRSYFLCQLHADCSTSMIKLFNYVNNQHLLYLPHSITYYGQLKFKECFGKFSKMLVGFKSWFHCRLASFFRS